MFGSQLLDIAIGIVFLYLLLSLICSGVNEILLSLLNMRGRDLTRGLRELLNEKDGKGIMEALYNHGLIYGLFKGDYKAGRAGNLPSYIPAKNFALAMMDIVPKLVSVSAKPSDHQELGFKGETRDTGTDHNRGEIPIAPPQNGPQNISGARGSTSNNANQPDSNPLKPLREAVLKLDDSKIREPMLTMIDAAGTDAVKARQNIEDWYNSSMDRISGWYKFRTQWVLFSLGILVAITFNADTFMAARLLSNDSALRQSLVATAQERAKQNNAQQVVADLKSDVSSLQELGLPIGWLPETADNADATIASSATAPNSRSTADRTRLLPLFRTGKAADWLWTWVWLFQVHGLGWLMTAVAVSLGAPFWFDLLNKFIVVRSTVKPREKSHEEKSKES